LTLATTVTPLQSGVISSKATGEGSFNMPPKESIEKCDKWIMAYMERISTKTPMCLNSNDLHIIQAYAHLRSAWAIEEQAQKSVDS
jgi:hypothetical protein